MERSRNCVNDHIEIIDKSTNKRMGRFCKIHNTGTIVTSGNKARIIFRSNIAKAKAGFELKYFTGELCCVRLALFFAISAMQKNCNNFEKLHRLSQCPWWRHMIFSLASLDQLNPFLFGVVENLHEKSMNRDISRYILKKLPKVIDALPTILHSKNKKKGIHAV